MEKVGFGKSTYVKKLAEEINDVNISQDELILELFGANLYINNPEDYEKYSSIIENYVIRISLEVAKAGATVICENGFWSKKERDNLKSLYIKNDIDFELHYIETTDNEMLDNIQ